MNRWKHIGQIDLTFDINDILDKIDSNQAVAYYGSEILDSFRPDELLDKVKFEDVIEYFGERKFREHIFGKDLDEVINEK